MTDNIDKMLARGEKLELLSERTDNLVFEVRAVLAWCGVAWCGVVWRGVVRCGHGVQQAKRDRKR
jgi:hypothetical protein